MNGPIKLTIQLTVLSGPCEGKKVTTHVFPVRIGRSDNVTLNLAEDHRVSRTHAELITTQMGEIILSDCESRLGTYVGDHRIRHTAISPNSIIKVGHSIIQISWEKQTPEVSAVPNPSFQWRMWVYGSIAVIFLGLLAILLLCPKTECVPPISRMVPEEGLQTALQARNRGDMTKAVYVLRNLLADSSLGDVTSEVAGLLSECQRLKKRFDIAYQYEDILRIESALDEWHMILLDEELLTPEDPLRQWIRTNRIEYLKKNFVH
ncbi:MAG: FHA domain-containing protein [Verrucomicrobiae bacterium]|nr:FHA domain-containing protein [Verrucomicrobiae bacterium]